MEGLSEDFKIPCNEEAEKAVIGSCLIQRSACELAISAIEPDDFYYPVHRDIFRCIGALVARQEPVDGVTLAAQMHADNPLTSETQTSYYLLELMNVPSSAANVEYYAGIVRDASIRRALLDVSQSITKGVFSEYGDVSELLDMAEQSVFAVGNRRRVSRVSPLSTLVSDSIDELEERYNHRFDAKVTGLPTPFDDLNYMTAGLQPTDLILIAARPSMGKTAFAMQLATHAAKVGACAKGGTVAVFSLEMGKTSLVQRMLSANARVNGHSIKTGMLTETDWARVGETASILAPLPIFIDDHSELSVSDIRASARRIQAEHGLCLVVIDYLQLIRTGAGSDNRAQELGDIANQLKAMAKELNIPVVALAQVGRSCEQRPDKRPMLSDLRESGSLEQAADIVMFLYRDSYYQRDKTGGKPSDTATIEEAEIIIAKHRNGPTGKIKVGFFDQYAMFADLVDESAPAFSDDDD